MINTEWNFDFYIYLPINKEVIKTVIEIKLIARNELRNQT